MPFIPGIAEQQVDQGALLWLLRTRAVHGGRLRLREIAGFDTRLDDHLEGLRLAGRDIWALCREPLAHPSRGEVFLAMSVALRLGDASCVRECLAHAGERHAVLEELSSALAWCMGEGGTAAAPWGELAASACPAERWVAVSASAAARNGRALAHVLARALADDDPRVRARAARGAGELGRLDLRAVLTDRLGDEPDVAASAAWSLVLFGDHDAHAHAVLRRAVEAGAATDPRRVYIAVLAGDPARSAGWVAALTGAAAVLGHTALGTIEAATWLLARLDDPSLGRLAADGFRALSGAEVQRSAADDPDVPADEREALRAWWSRFRTRMPSGTRVVGGRALDGQMARELLTTGPQGIRAIAALWLAVERPQDGLFPTEAPAFRQDAALRRMAAVN